MGRYLMMSGEHLEKLLDGRKKTTIRLGRIVPKYKEIIIHSRGRPACIAEIIGYRFKRVSELSDDDAQRDGFRSLEELIRELRRRYGDISLEDEVTIIELRVLNKIPSEAVRDPYRGLKPHVIARLALERYRDELDAEEIRVLEEILRSRSIRRASIRLYGSIEARRRIRRILRRMAERISRDGALMEKRSKAS
ncbi:MAG: ASCH domain-containing protein [Sulfolobales archaeon]